MLLSILKKRGYFSVGDQVVLSTANFGSSIVVLSSGGIAQLGIYSFVFVFCSFIAISMSTLLHRQMMLEISSSSISVRRNILKKTLFLQVFLLIGILLSIVLFLYVFYFTVFSSSISLIIGAIFYIFFFTIYELFRSYLYISNKHYLSFRVTLRYLLVYILLCLVVVLFLPARVEVILYFALAFSFATSVFSNKYILRTLSHAAHFSVKDIVLLFYYYFRSGKFALGGMFLSWVQLQSVNPLLMFLGGPVTAGYFSVARMIVVPALVFNQGLINSTAPKLRRVLEQKNCLELDSHISKESKHSLLFFYLLLLFIITANYFKLFDQIVPDFQQVKGYLFVWLVVTFISLQRTWVTQFFVIRAEFVYLLKINICVVMVLAILFSLFTLFTTSLPWILTAVVFAEMLLIMVLFYKRRLDLSDLGRSRKSLNTN